jgi:hypothetical protein
MKKPNITSANINVDNIIYEEEDEGKASFDEEDEKHKAKRRSRRLRNMSMKVDKDYFKLESDDGIATD